MAGAFGVVCICCITLAKPGGMAGRGVEGATEDKGPPPAGIASFISVGECFSGDLGEVAEWTSPVMLSSQRVFSSCFLMAIASGFASLSSCF